MKKSFRAKRVIAFTVVLAMVFAMSIPSYAAWSSYQRTNENLGRATAAPTGTSPAVTASALATNGTVYSGIDTAPVINGNNAYVLYNGGAVSGSDGGARLAKYDLTSPSAATWNLQLSTLANDNQQLSTPYLDTSNNIVYAGVTSYQNDIGHTDRTGWKDTSNNQIAGFSFPTGTTTAIHYDGLVISGDYWQPQLTTDINTTASGLSGSVTLYDGTNTYALGTSSYYGGNFTLYNNNGTMIPAGTYTLTVNINNSTGTTLNANSFQFLTSRWNIYKVTNINSTPTASSIANGYGQINTHINTTDNYLYFGLYEGDRCFYQCTSAGALTQFKPAGGEDFYWAGSAKYGSSNVVFGSESGKVYKRPTGATFGSATGSSINLTSTKADAGHIRSSVCYDGSNFYLTSTGGYLWKLPTDLSSASYVTIKDSSAPIYVQNSSSTPVVSSNGYVYVGGYYTNYATYESYGAVKGVPTSSFSDANLKTIYTGDAVQCSPVVYSPNTTFDYVYFTTNSSDGAGYCYRFRPSNSTVTSIWGTSAGSYTLQGMAASDSGYMVFGNDANTLYVIH